MQKGRLGFWKCSLVEHEFYWLAFVNNVGPFQGRNTGITQMWVQILFLPVIVTLGKLSDFLFLLCLTNALNVSQIADKHKKRMCMKALCTHAWQTVGCPVILSVSGDCYFLNKYVLSFVISTRGYNTSVLLSYRCMFELKQEPKHISADCSLLCRTALRNVSTIVLCYEH